MSGMFGIEERMLPREITYYWSINFIKFTGIAINDPRDMLYWTIDINNI